MNDFQVRVFLKLRIELANPFDGVQFDSQQERDKREEALKGWVPNIRQDTMIAAGRPENKAIVNTYGAALMALRVNPASYQVILDGLNPDALPFSQAERDELRRFKANPGLYFKQRCVHIDSVVYRDPRLHA